VIDGALIGVAITLLAYLVIVTSFVVGLRKDVNALQDNFSSFKSYFNSLEDLKKDFIRLETKIELLLKLPREEWFFFFFLI